WDAGGDTTACLRSTNIRQTAFCRDPTKVSITLACATDTGSESNTGRQPQAEYQPGPDISGSLGRHHLECVRSMSRVPIAGNHVPMNGVSTGLQMLKGNYRSTRLTIDNMGSARVLRLTACVGDLHSGESRLKVFREIDLGLRR